MKNPSTIKHVNPLVITLVYYLSFIVFGLVSAAEGPSLPTLARHTASALDQLSLIFVFVSLGYLVGSFLSGQAYDRFPGHRLMALSLALIGASAVLIPAAGSLWLLLLAFFLLGLATGALDVGCNTLLLWVHGEKVGPFMNGLHFFFGVGALISPLILAQVLSITGDIHWLFWMCALACVPLVVWLWFLPEPPAAAHAANGVNAPFPVFPVVLLVVLFILYVGLEMGFGNWLYTYALTLKLGTEISAAYLTSALWGAFTLGRLLGVWTAARARSQTILFMDLTGCLASAAVILLWRESALALWIGSIGLGLCMASIFPTILMLAGERMRVTGAITGWFLVGSGAGNMILPWLIGQVFVGTGPQAMPVIVLVDIIALLLVLVYFVTQRVGLPAVRRD
jgi:FHS family Na+ dependent glucose MFS transporter 1